MKLSTTEKMAGYKIIEVKGIARGSTVRAKMFANDFLAAIKNIVGGEITEYTKLLADSREQALKRMVADAEALGADGIVNVRFTTSTVMSGSAEILAYGTAVKLSLDD